MPLETGSCDAIRPEIFTRAHMHPGGVLVRLPAVREADGPSRNARTLAAFVSVIDAATIGDAGLPVDL
jgi:hypothetical protein